MQKCCSKRLAFQHHHICFHCAHPWEGTMRNTTNENQWNGSPSEKISLLCAFTYRLICILISSFQIQLTCLTPFMSRIYLHQNIQLLHVCPGPVGCTCSLAHPRQVAWLPLTQKTARLSSQREKTWRWCSVQTHVCVWESLFVSLKWLRNEWMWRKEEGRK